MLQTIQSTQRAPVAQEWLGILQVISAAVCWGSLGIFSTYLNQQGFSGLQITILRIVTAGILILIMLPKLWPDLKSISFKQYLGLASQSFIGILGMTLFYFFAVIQIGVGPAVALLYTAPLFSLVFSALLLGEKITRHSLMLVVLGFSGVALMVLDGKSSINWGIGLGLLSGLCYSLYGVLGKQAVKANHSPSLVFFTSILFSASLFIFVPETYTTYAQAMALSPITWVYIIGLSFIGTVLPFSLYMSALHKLSATRASTFTTFEPLTAILLAVILLNQSLTLLQYLGVSFIIIASLLNSLLKNETPE